MSPGSARAGTLPSSPARERLRPSSRSAPPFVPGGAPLLSSTASTASGSGSSPSAPALKRLLLRTPGQRRLSRRRSRRAWPAMPIWTLSRSSTMRRRPGCSTRSRDRKGRGRSRRARRRRRCLVVRCRGARHSRGRGSTSWLAARISACRASGSGVRARLARRREPVGQVAATSVYLDLGAYLRGSTGSVPFTPAIPALAALDAALDELLERGSRRGRRRYRSGPTFSMRSSSGLGLEPIVVRGAPSRTVRSVPLPAGVTYEHLHEGSSAWLRDLCRPGARWRARSSGSAVWVRSSRRS